LEKPATVHYRPVVDQIIHPNPLDPLSALFFVVAFVAMALLTARRPAYGLVALICVVPFALYRDALGSTITLPKIALLGVLLGLTTYGGAFARLREGPALRILAAAALVLAATAFSIAQADVVQPAIRETLKALEYPAFFAAVYVAYRLDPDTKLIVWAIAAVTAMVSLSALAQELLGAPSGIKYPNNSIIPRIAGPLEGPNQLAGYLEVSIAMLAACTCARPQRVTSIVLGLAIVTDVMTFSRGGLAGAFIALVVVTIVYGRAARALITPIISGLAIGLLGAGFWAAVAHTLAVFGGRMFAGNDYAGGVGSRAALWSAAITLWREHPWLGVGAGNFELDLPRAGLFGIRTHANSLYLQALVEGGIPLFLATLALLGTVIFTFARRAAVAPFVAGALAASTALALHQIGDYLIFYPKVGEWWWIALALGAAELGAREGRLEPAAACA
jgi:O-antigen ligase